MYAACFEAKEEPDRNYDINYFVYENNEEYFIETYLSGKSDVSTAYLGKCGAERAEAIAMRFAKGALRPVHLEDALCDIAF